jgi:transposase
MRGRKAPPIALSQAERQALEQVVKRPSTAQQIALRARIVLAAGAGRRNDEIAHQEAVAINTVRRWRKRWLALQPLPLTELSVTERLEDAPRPGSPGHITDEQFCQIVALACETPAQSGRPISQWTGREIADEVRRRGIVERISPRHAARLLKKGICSRTASATG